jgi:AcrR family transcriptional regulator
VTTSPSADGFQRARTDNQKEARRQAILEAARAHLAKVGFEGFSMGPLAKAAGVARGTLYLYFPTREELLYTLHLEALHGWKDALFETTEPDMTTEAYLAAYFDSAQRAPLVLETLPRVPSVLERNLSMELLINGKRQNRAIAVAAAEHMAKTIGVSEPTAYGLLRGLLALLIGTTHALQRPDVALEPLPEDVQQDLAAMDPRAAFLEAAVWMVRGAS